MSENKTIRIVSVMPHGPAYDYYKGARPDICWELPGGGVAGFWPREWMDLLGAEILKVVSGYEWEVWQPDLRADRIYSHKLPTGVTHRLFPAEERTWGSGLLAEKGLWSGQLTAALLEAAAGGERTLVLLYGTYGFRLPFFTALLGLLRGVRIPVYMRSGGMFRAPASDLLGLHRPFTYLKLLKEHSALKEALARADAISEQSSAALAEVRKIYGGRVERVTLGCDFGFWRPASPGEKEAARSKLGVAPWKKIFFASGNFVPRKQLDRLAGTFAALGKRDDFFLLIAGHGGEKETARMRELMAPLAEKGCAMLHPYSEGEALRDLYWASDVYASVATDEGGPASVMKALACGIPVLTTPVGETADSLRETSSGRFVPVEEHGTWRAVVIDMLFGALPRAMPLSEARARYDWPRVAARYIRIFDELCAKYYGERDEQR